ncbi:MAG TPA: DUF523 and DUF1722 domain-containing protein [Candidatus Binatia bacterium]|nr:DUF523 and DUF1722 domain-containing protein [Candidatus Binatia bacterium]
MSTGSLTRAISVVDPPIRIGVSSCLLGNRVRYDGGHKRDDFLVDVLGRYVQWVPVCPEAEIGFGVPRPTLRLERVAGTLRLMMPKTGDDHTQRMQAFAARRVAKLAADHLCGFILKKDSPSCGMERVKVYDRSGMPTRSGQGLFAAVLVRYFPNLPVEEDGRLNDPELREAFIERVFAYRRLRTFFDQRWTVGGLVAFHTLHKLQLMAHARAGYERLGRLVAEAKRWPRAALRERYEREFMRTLAVMATKPRHTNVLQHIVGYFKRHLDEPSRRELRALVDDYRRGLIPLVVPLTLVSHYVRRFDVVYLAGQTYLAPHPKELMLRNHV